jgi:hypothetical protein
LETRTKTVAILLIAALATAGCKRSNVETANQSNPVSPSTSPTTSRRSVDVVKATPQPVDIAAGKSAEAVVKLNIESGFHVNANPPSYPYLKPTELEVPRADGVSVAFIVYPNALSRNVSFAEKPLAVYEGEVTIKANLKADATMKPGQKDIAAKLNVQACDDQVCYAPGTIDLVIPVNIK